MPIVRCMPEHGGGAIVEFAVAAGVSVVPRARTPRLATLDPIMDIDLRALAPLLVLAAALAVYALVDLVRAPDVRYLPKWAWALICVLSMPLGPLAYLTLGRAPR